MIIEKLDFKNNDLSMKGNGKWIKLANKEITFFDAVFQSNNFGSSLKNLRVSWDYQRRKAVFKIYWSVERIA